MAGGSLLMLLDDVATLLDDVALMTKTAAHKTVGVLGDDLALGAKQLEGISARRELPVVWAVAKGSFVNKLILVPLAMLISAFSPWGVTPLLMVGGAYLCYEGAEKIWDGLVHRIRGRTPEEKREEAQHRAEVAEAAKTERGSLAYEKKKIRGAVRTDFILSAEIVSIALGTVKNASLFDQFIVVSIIAVLVTVGVYGVVGVIVKLDDMGLFLQKCDSGLLQSLGGIIISAAPWLMRALSVAGTVAMFLVGGGILIHGMPWLDTPLETLAHSAGVLEGVVQLLLITGAGVFAGAVVLALVSLVARLLPHRQIEAG